MKVAKEKPCRTSAPTYEVRSGNEWRRAKTGEEHGSGWLTYELSDGTTGLAQPKNWRIQEKS